jgi:hypothetical protein
MATTIMATPRTPTKKADSEEINRKIKAIVESLSFNWDLRLKTTDPSESPEKRSRTPEEECVAKIVFLCWKFAIDPPLGRFSREADILYSRWVHKPKSERGVVPKATRQSPKPVTSEERQQLLQCLLQNLTPDYDRIKMESGSPWSVKRRAMGLVESNAALGSSGLPRFPAMDDSPLPFPLTTKSKIDPKHRLDTDAESTFKKPKLPEPTSSRAPFSRMHSVSVNLPLSSGNLPQRNTRSAETSFAETDVTSNASSIFSNDDGSMLINTQSTTADDIFQGVLKQGMQDAVDHSQSSDFGSSFDPDLLGLNFGNTNRNIDLIDLTDDLSEDLIDLESRANDTGAKSEEDELHCNSQTQPDQSKVRIAEEKLHQYLRAVFRKWSSILFFCPSMSSRV